MMKNSWPKGEWCVVGDFNVVKKERERKGTHDHFNKGEASEFNSFIVEMNLIDVPIVGSKFIWHKPNGGAMTRLDRFLVSEPLLLVWKVDA